MIETYSQIVNNLKKGKFSQIYLLMGEETFFINKISNFLEKNYISEDQKGFNQEIHYGKDSSLELILNSCKSFPMMSDKKIVIIKEAQELDVFRRKNNERIDKLINYIQNPNKSTLLLICHKNKNIDKRSKVFKSFLSSATILESDSKENKIYDNKLSSWIKQEASNNNYDISDDALILLIENIGNSLEKINNALEKIYLNKNDNIIKLDDIINIVGINRDYNYFEFQDSLIEKNVIKCMKIVNYFSSNEKKYPIQQVIGYLFSFYSKLLVVKSRNLSSSDNISDIIGVHPYVGKSYIKAKSNYRLNEIILIIKHLKNLDLISKGIINFRYDYQSIIYELLFKIFINK